DEAGDERGRAPGRACVAVVVAGEPGVDDCTGVVGGEEVALPDHPPQHRTDVVPGGFDTTELGAQRPERVALGRCLGFGGSELAGRDEGTDGEDGPSFALDEAGD